MKEILDISLDTNVIISLFKPEEEMYLFAKEINEISSANKINLYVSLKTIDELQKYISRYGCEQFQYANSLKKLPNFIINDWKDQVGSWSDLVDPSWDNIIENEKIHKDIQMYLTKGVKIRDRQIVLDSILGKMDILITNDSDLCAIRPATHHFNKYDLEVLTPKTFLMKYNL